MVCSLTAARLNSGGIRHYSRMKNIVAAFVLFGFALAVVAGERENPLQLWAANYRGPSSTGHPPICLTSYLKRSHGKPVLAFRLTNNSTNSFAVSPFQLPWGNPYSIALVAVATDGERLPNMYPIADPPVQKKIIIAPSQSLEGDYELRVIDFSPAPKDKDIVVLWSYAFPRDFRSPEPPCTGVVVIPKRP